MTDPTKEGVLSIPDRSFNKCQCTNEQGDSDCAKHPRCPNCNEDLSKQRLAAEYAVAIEQLDAALARATAAEQRYEQCREAHAALIQTHMRVMDEKNALVLEVKEWRTTKGDAGK